ncbi:preprotein translocase subunit YajC [Methylophilaceae bacterium]|nr:preprotein translocase subunit YajC [Methylophilaceae bacterium]MDB4138191.1 preprotein translocase subunit YajC [Methylophilaceae bacterium]
MSFLPFIIIFVLFYFMLIRPQMKQAKEHRAMLDALKTGDEIVTTTGILGKVVKLSNQFSTIEIASNVEIKIQKQTIQTLLPKGTIKSI